MNRGKIKRALVVDDDQEIRTAIKAALTRAGYEVEASGHLPSAVGAGLSRDYTVITLDLSMPDISGQEIATMLKVCGVSTPVLVVSGNLNDETVAKLRQLGIRHFLHKPFTIPNLLAAVQDAITGLPDEPAK